MNYNEAIATMEAGANHIGLVPMQSGGIPAQRVPLDVADRIYQACRKRQVKSVSIMLNKDPDEMLFLAKRLKPDILHIAGMGYTANRKFAKELKKISPHTKLMQAVLIDNKSAIDRAKKYSQYCDFLLDDSGLAKDTGIGASGKTHDWRIDKQIVQSVNIPVIIAGGLGPDNVADCIKEVRPYGVDSLTKTSHKYMDGVVEKDLPKVKLFCKRADQAAKEINL